MKNKTIFILFLFSLFSAMLVLACQAQSLAVTHDSYPSKEGTYTPSMGAPESYGDPANFWRPFLWEALPVEWLRDGKQAAILEAYQKRDWKPFFISRHFEPTEGAHALLRRLETVESEAIDASPYQLSMLKERIRNLDQLRIALRETDPYFSDAPSGLSEATLLSGSSPSRSTAAPVHYAMNSPEGRLPVSAHPPDKEQKYQDIFRASSELDMKLAHSLIRFAQEMNPFSKDEQMKALLGEVPISVFLRDLEPKSPHYQPLLKAYQRYRDPAGQAVQASLHGEADWRLGESGGHVRDLQKRLGQEGFYKGKISGLFDKATQEALQRSLRAHKPEPESGASKEWLGLSHSHKANALTYSLRALRQSPARQYENGRFVRINIPQFLLEYHKDGMVHATHRVVVGKAGGKKVKLQGQWVGENQTPVLASSIERVIVNPRWYLTDRIRRELSDEIAADPSYFARHGYVQMPSVYPSGLPRLFQLPGPKNALGRFKFEFSNGYAIYLHDTPQKHLFQRSRRDFSHGCIRVDKPYQLAQLLLEEDQNPAARKIDAYLSTTKPVFINLAQPLPIVVEYLPVATDGNGRIVFFGDPYGRIKGEPSSKS